MTPDLARRIALATLDPVTFGIVHDTALAVAAGRPVQVDHGFGVAEVEAAVADRAELTRVYRDESARRDFATATLAARTRWLEGLEAEVGREADRRRLDWLEERLWDLYANLGRTRWFIDYTTVGDRNRSAEGPTLRAAIDIAMAEWAAHATEESPDA